MTRRQAKRRKEQKPGRWKTVSIPYAGIGKLAAAIAIVAMSYQVSARLLDQPIRAITIDGPFQRVSALQIEEAIAEELTAGFLTADIDRIQEKVTALPWIDQASVARRWPGMLQIHVTEQVPAALWGERGLLNVRGELFVDQARHVPAELPRLSGPAGRSAEVATTYLRVREKLIPMGVDLRRVSLDARGAWQITLHNGVEIRLGRRDVEERLSLFIDVVANLVSSREEEIDFVDMRYGNGFTIGWAGTETRPSPASADGSIKGMVAGHTQ